MLCKQARIKGGVLLRREGIAITTHLIKGFSKLRRAERLGALEQ